jgi:ElaB/YqjD/DUF883 family membrane-anchored ribosome-binding protein
MDNRIEEKHESFGLLEINRISNSGSENLFGSSIKHNNTITILIKPARRVRELNRDWYFDYGIPFIEIEMSPTQFAEAITSMNHGSGVPVTIRRLQGKRMEPCPEINKRQQFENEFKEQMENIRNDLTKLIKDTKEILSSKKAITVAEKKTILSQIEMLIQEVGSNLPFVNSQFNEQMDKTVLEAKGETEAFFINKINQLGLNELKKQEFLMLEQEDK